LTWQANPESAERFFLVIDDKLNARVLLPGRIGAF